MLPRISFLFCFLFILSYLETRLDSELARSASSEQDLAFFLIAIEKFDFKNPIIPQLTNIL